MAFRPMEVRIAQWYFDNRDKFLSFSLSQTCDDGLVVSWVDRNNKPGHIIQVVEKTGAYMGLDDTPLTLDLARAMGIQERRLSFVKDMELVEKPAP